ncbi:MAG: hypothetical protein KDA79_23960, partial [Planctomycetaceae bacterium]|nr:hypothetical protein [Planctomycetaceae bacterium]
MMEAVGRVFDELQQQYRHTVLVLLSPLNEGADRLAAKVAKKKGVQLIAVLAWPEGVCNDQLHRTGSEAEFNELLSGAAHVVHLSLIEGTSEADIQNSKDARAVHYAQVGAYIARHSQYLIALWDGENTPRGGTARVVRWQREGKTAPFAPNVGLLDEVESGPVCHILTPRSGRNPPDGAMTRKILYPEGTAARPDERQAEREFRRVWQNLDRFNRDAARLQTHSAGAVRASRGYVLSNADVARLST